MAQPGYIDQLVDWRSFENFVRDMFGTDPNLVVEHDVTEKGRSGAKRQTDVKFTHRVGGLTFTTLVECKRWKEPVSRDRIDVLAASIGDLNANKGVMFTTSGYEQGAELYARDRGIDLFVVRDLTDEEWGLPGRVVTFWWQFFNAKIGRINIHNPQLIPIVERFPTEPRWNFEITKDRMHDPEMTLYSVVDGEPGVDLLTLMLDARTRALDLLAKSQNIFKEVKEDERFFVMPIRLDMSTFPTRQVMRKYGPIRFERIDFDLVVHVQQRRYRQDRGEHLDFALAVENFVTHQRNVIARPKEGDKVEVFELASDRTDEPREPIDPSEIVSENTLLCVFYEPWISFPKIESDLWPTKRITFQLPDWDVSVSESVPAEYYDDGSTYEALTDS